MIIMPVKEGENIEKALKKFKRKYERTGVLKELRRRQYFTKPSVAKRIAMQHAIYVEKLLNPDNRQEFFILSIIFLLFYSGLLSVSPAKLNFLV